MLPIFGHNVYQCVRSRVIVVHDERMLLLEPYEARAGWRVPGGGLEQNESIAECGEREVMEETGLAVKVTRMAFLREFVVPKYCTMPGGDDIAYGMEVFLYADLIGDTLEPRRENEREPMPYWIDLARVPTMPLWPKELKTLAALLATGYRPHGIPLIVSDLETPDALAPEVDFG
ncbi:MAG: NUDIX domain-containing protein [Chloroflexi bacterium]|nr:NUDIX domain-containing protein [Chloroflexota bacterium]